MATATAAAIALLLASKATAQNTPVPISVPWSSHTYGPDGPWNAVNVELGDPQQSLDLIPAGYYPSYVLSRDYCSNTRNITQQGYCTAEIAGLYDGTQSDDSPLYEYYEGSTIAYQPGAQGINGPSITNGSVTMSWDVLNFAGVQVPNVSLGVIDEAFNTLPDGTQYPLTIGHFSLGADAFNQTFGFGDSEPAINLSITPSYLYRNKVVPSSSIGLHIGAAAAGIPGSMIIGGYDKSRALGPYSSQPIGSTGPTLGLGLLDISFGVAEGASPFNYTSRSGLLTANNNSIPSQLLVGFDFAFPYMALPRSTCDAITTDLPVTYSSKYNLYLWNTSAPNYSTIVSSASYLSFTFAISGTSNNMTISAPWSLFNLTLTAPLTDTDTAYFPCYPYDGYSEGSYTLGRAFLQAAFIAINWAPSNPPGTWFIAQAPGPGGVTSVLTTAIQQGSSSLSTSSADWARTWSGHWTALDSSSSSGDDTTSDNSGLSTGAKAGIGVGAALGGLALIAMVVLAIYISRRRKQQRAAAAAGGKPGATGEPGSETSMLPPGYGNGNGHGVGAGGATIAEKRAPEEHAVMHEVPADEVREMPADRHGGTGMVHELPAEREGLMNGSRV